MKQILATAALCSITAASVAAEPAFGVWKSGVDAGLYGHIEVYQCGEKVCGKVLAQFDADTNAPADNENTGKRILWDFEPQGDGTYENGKTYRAANGRTYRSRMRMRGSDSMRVSGCLGPICIPQNWSRIR